MIFLSPFLTCSVIINLKKSSKVNGQAITTTCPTTRCIDDCANNEKTQFANTPYAVIKTKTMFKKIFYELSLFLAILNFGSQAVFSDNGPVVSSNHFWVHQYITYPNHYKRYVLPIRYLPQQHYKNSTPLRGYFANMETWPATNRGVSIVVE